MQKFEKRLVELDNFMSIQKACNYALENSKMIAVFGYEGAGKTIALRKFYKENRNTQFIKVRKSMTTMNFYSELLGTQSISNRGYKSLYGIMNRLRSINYGNEKRLLIIDEVGKFKFSDLEYLHEFRDLTEESLGIILAGPEYFHDDLLFGVRNKVKGIPEFYRRINFKIWLDRPKKKEITAICNTYEITDKKLINNRFCKNENFASLSDDIESFLMYEREDSF
ncbi:ATP-binding protein [uncultured Aquimarina sp.]|uniref:ATP-binding protein n=1 Tax=uncultured Aquimarina sp. TaxID=575652 RepID=UPI002621DD50|nr:ATP-binding protein [uncultured Aquimarina sp.]